MVNTNIYALNSRGDENHNKVTVARPFLFKFTYGCDSTRYTASYIGLTEFNVFLKSKSSGSNYNVESFSPITISPLELPCI